MLKRTLFFGSPGKLSIKNTLLQYEPWQEGEIRKFPLEDLGCLVIESLQMVVTTQCLNALAKQNIAVIFCDEQHMPSAQMLPFSGNTLTQKNSEAQLLSTTALKGKLWQQTVKSKLVNQAKCLEKLGLPCEKMLYLARNTSSGDKGNAEAVGARYYFQQLGLDDPFLRTREGDPPNNALNYGYAILRAACARALIGSGLLCCIGIHHSNQYNAFCLADDIMEPYRPFVDEMIFSERAFFTVPELQKEHKAKLLQSLVMDVKIGNECRPLVNALSFTSASLARCFLKEEKEIAFPEFV